MKYYLDFPAGSEGGYEGRHWFYTKRERATFLGRMFERGIINVYYVGEKK